MAATTVFIDNRSQAVRQPAELGLPGRLRQVSIRARVKERILAPIEATWDSFLLTVSPSATTSRKRAPRRSGPRARPCNAVLPARHPHRHLRHQAATGKSSGDIYCNAARMTIAMITLAELLHGAEKSSCHAINLAVVEYFISRLDIFPDITKAAHHDGQICAALGYAGQPIEVNDLHIAAHARSEGMTLVTNNIGGFSRVPSLRVENWLRP
ncbi:MAG: PIN domain-containing protein [Thiomonas sp.]